MNRSIAAAAVFILGASAVFAQDFDAGSRAYEAGDYATALKEWTPLAEQGDAARREGKAEAIADERAALPWGEGKGCQKW